MPHFDFEIHDKTDRLEGRWLEDDELKLSITHNGYQWNTLVCTKEEWRKIITRLEPMTSQDNEPT